MSNEMELLFQSSRTSPILHEAVVTIEAELRNANRRADKAEEDAEAAIALTRRWRSDKAAAIAERDELVIQNELLGNDLVAAEAALAEANATAEEVGGELRRANEERERLTRALATTRQALQRCCDETDYCYVCDCHPSSGHAEGCALAAADGDTAPDVAAQGIENQWNDADGDTGAVS